LLAKPLLRPSDWPLRSAASWQSALVMVMLAAGFLSIAASQLALGLALLLMLYRWFVQKERPPFTGLERTAAALALWALAMLALFALIAWPLSALLQGQTLGAAVAVSAVVGGALIGLWRTWPLWRWQEGEGGALQAHWRALGDIDTRAWRGLGVALLLALPSLVTKETVRVAVLGLSEVLR